jgi:sugar O-acyltransferase (sialic acid O-acetyltransferase NeuD family)
LSAEPIIVLGAGGNSLGILDALASINALDPARPRYRLEGVLDDIPENRGRKVLGCEVIGVIADAPRHRGCRFVNGISSLASFRRIPDIIARTGLAAESFATVIHPRATVASSAFVGAGSVILAGSVICPEARVGEHVIILQNTTVNHHSKVGDFSTLSAGITVLGYVDIGRNAFVGGGCTIAPSCRIGDGSLVGAGSVVIRDVPAGKVFAGNPAREIAGSRHAIQAR